MKFRIAIIGGGISALTAAYLIKKKFINKVAIDIISNDDLGGEFLKGGFKYMYYTKDIADIFDQLNIPYELKVINGALYYQDKIYQYPFCLFSNQVNNKVQNEYWMKTRDDAETFDDRCMNNPWSLRTEIKIEPLTKNKYADYLLSIIEFIKRDDGIRSIVATVDSKNIQHMYSEYDLIIYTIPITILLESMNIKYNIEDFINQSLCIIRAEADTYKIWWDYLYVPESGFPFHRISKIGKNNYLDFEVNNNNYKYIYECIKRFGKKIDIDKISITNDYAIKLKGQISIDAKISHYNIFDNIILLGRFAEWNKKITYDLVVHKILNEIIPNITKKIG
jgi:hypothetical protein